MSVSTTLAPALDDRVLQEPDRYRRWKWLARLGLLTLAVGLIAAHTNLADLARAFTRLRPAYLLTVVLVLSPLAVLLRSLRWRYLLPGGERIPLLDYVGAYLAGILANSLLLGKFGDLVRARMICGTHIDYSRSLAAVVVDRLLEGAALLFIFAGVLVASPLPTWTHRLAWVAGVAILGMLAVLRLLVHHRERLAGLAEPLVRRLPAFLAERLVGVTWRLLTGCQALRDIQHVLVAVLYGLAVWAVEITSVMVFLKSFSIPAPWLIAAPVMIVVLNLGTLVPISPGSVGVYQWLCAFTLSPWGVDRELGIALGIVMQTVLFVPLYLAGAAWLLTLTRGRSSAATVLPTRADTPAA